MPWKDPEKNRQYSHQRYLAHREEARASDKKRLQELRTLILSHYSKGELKCAHCGVDDIDVLCIDHINNDGAEEQGKTVRSGSGLYGRLKSNNYPEGFQVFCHNCNFKKRLRHKENKEELCSEERK